MAVATQLAGFSVDEAKKLFHNQEAYRARLN